MFKKFLLILILSFLNSCSNDSEVEQNNSTTELQNVPTQITETIYYSGTSETTTTKFNYSNGKLDSFENIAEGRKTTITYNGDKPTKFSVYVNGSLYKEQLVTYNGDKIVLVADNLNQEKTEFYYTNDVLDLITHSSFSGSNWVTNSTDKYFFGSSNLVKQYHTTYYPSTSATKREYEYDNKNNPFKNLNKYIKLLLSFETINVGNLNNSTSARYFASVSDTTPESNRNFVNTYNSSDYPITIIKNITESSTQISKMEMTY